MARRFNRVGHTKRLTSWDATSPETTYIPLAAATVALDSTFVSIGPQTIVRVRGQLAVSTDQDVADEDPFGAVGLCIVSDEAAAVGVTAMPKPYIDAESDLWFMHEFWTASVRFGSTVGFARVEFNLRLDSKGMRRFSEDQTIVLMMENAAAASGANYRLDLRILTMLT